MKLFGETNINLKNITPIEFKNQIESDTNAESAALVSIMASYPPLLNVFLSPYFYKHLL